MNNHHCFTITFAISLCIGITNAKADEYQSVELSQHPLAITVAGQRHDGYWVQMSQSVSADYGILSDQAWDTNDIDENWYQIYSEQHGSSFCLTIIESDLPGINSYVVLNPCDGYNLAQAWRDEENSDGYRFYNAAMAETACLSVVLNGEQQNLLTMTDCGTGDVSSELWKLQNSGRPIGN